AGNIGDNWAFARIRRNAPAAMGSTNVTAHFLVSEFGTGSGFSDDTTMNPDLTFDPDTVVGFNAADVGPTITPASHWTLAATASIRSPGASSARCLRSPARTPFLLRRAAASCCAT